jgi:heat shock protein HtpX
MSYLRTAILLAAMTALFMGIGFLLGGQSGMVIALLVAAAMNLFAYWNSDKMVLSMYGAREVDARSASELYALVGRLASAAGLPMPRVFIMENPQPKCLRHRTQSVARLDRGDDRTAQHRQPGRAGRRAGA